MWGRENSGSSVATRSIKKNVDNIKLVSRWDKCNTKMDENVKI